MHLVGQATPTKSHTSWRDVSRAKPRKASGTDSGLTVLAPDSHELWVSASHSGAKDKVPPRMPGFWGSRVELLHVKMSK